MRTPIISTPASRTKGFTLIELLVVIAIIALLAAILFPVFGRVRENARKSACQSNMKQIGLGILQYMQDYDENPPIGNRAAPHYALGIGWASSIMPYIKSAQVFRCPSEKGNRALPDVAASYAYNQGFVRDRTNTNDLILKPLPAWTAPSRTILCFEVRYGYFDSTDSKETDSPCGTGQALWGAGSGNGNTNLQYAMGEMDGALGADASGNNWQDTSGIAFPAVHLEGGNYLAADGHVKWCKGSSISAGWYNTNSTNASISTYAEGTEYAGADKHQLTMSYK